RAAGRRMRQQQLLQHRTGSGTDTLGTLGLIMVWIGMAFINGLAGYVVHDAMAEAQQVDQQQGKIVVSGSYFIKAIRELENAKTLAEKKAAEEQLKNAIEDEAEFRSDE